MSVGPIISKGLTFTEHGGQWECIWKFPNKYIHIGNLSPMNGNRGSLLKYGKSSSEWVLSSHALLFACDNSNSFHKTEWSLIIVLTLHLSHQCFAFPFGQYTFSLYTLDLFIEISSFLRRDLKLFRDRSRFSSFCYWRLAILQGSLVISVGCRRGAYCPISTWLLFAASSCG